MDINDLQGAEFDKFVESIAPDVMRLLEDRKFFEKLEAKVFANGPEAHPLCNHNFAISKKTLSEVGFSDEDHLEIYAVLAARGGRCCDCEILYNAAPNGCAASRAYWKAEAAKIVGTES